VSWRQRLRRWGSILPGSIGIAVASAVLGACGGGVEPTHGVVAAAGPATAAAGSASVQVTVVSLPEVVGLTRFPPEVWSGEVSWDNSIERLTNQYDPNGLTEIRTRNAIYETLTPPELRRFPGKHWSLMQIQGTIPLQRVGRAIISLFPETSLQVDPADLVGDLTPFVRSIVTLGDEEVRGSNTQHYRLTLDMTAVRTALDSSNLMPTALYDQLVLPWIDTLGGPSHVVDLWLDSAGQVRRLSIEAAALSLSQQPAREITSTVEFWNFGRPVTIITPSAAETVPVSELTPASQTVQP